MFFTKKNARRAVKVVIEDVNGALAMLRNALGGAGGGPTFPDEEISTDPDTFEVVETFDVGAPALVLVKFVVTAVDGDGETFGSGAGQIYAFASVEQSQDGVLWGGDSPLIAPVKLEMYSPALIAPGDLYFAVYLIGRYGRITLQVIDVDSGFPYAGANNPTITGTVHYKVIAM